MSAKQSVVQTLHDLGFDMSTWCLTDKAHRVRCSQCAALVINGIPTHEHGCPNRTHECAGCTARIPYRQKYCEDCA